ncbi:hypothetical protein [Roseovarius sp. SYSU LYC5161]|uniref:hypothetical protein n=1 Tax=Roseovarius halophilus (ex Wu et al. 2025) TaxID=3376060 RepID=UPI00399BCCF0
MTDHLPPDARAAHGRMLDAFDAMMTGAIRRAGEATEAKARREGATPHEAAQAAQDHVNRLLIEMTRERARLEAEGARRQ